MDPAAIALNRFGLGARPSDMPPRDPRAWLTGQFAAWDPKPATIAQVPSRSTVVEDLAQYIEQQRTDRQNGATPQPRRARPGENVVGSVMDGQANSTSMTTPGADPTAGLPPSAAQFLRRGLRGNYQVMNAARLNAAVASETPFVERLAHFWANHFAVSADKLQVIGLAGLLEFEAIRPHVLGKFSDMLVAVEQHPAMLLYLDQVQSIGPNSRAAALAARRGNQRGLNENLGREILELHTLGVHGGYSQADVTEFARALTGWTVGGLNRGPAARLLGGGVTGEFLFADPVHEPGERTIMGKRYGEGGEAQARAVLANLALHPSTATHLATKLARHFAGDDPPEAMIDRLAQAYKSSGGDLPTVYSALIASPEAWAAEPVKFKTPWEWTVSSMRGIGGPAMSPQAVSNALTELGQPTWRPGSPAGWDDIAASWAAPDALVRRVEVAQRIATQFQGSLDPRALAGSLLPGSVSDATHTAISRAESPQQGLALLLVSPEFMRR
jgi:uncharacterized protein (DUF1800 family)